MGLLDKMKNLFTEEVEEPVKSEVMQVEIPSPVKKDEIESENVEDTKEIKKEETKATPIFFDDAYFKELEQPKVPKKEVKSSYMKEKALEKKFTPTPIISPVYGVLDKNYNKEDITTKKERENMKRVNNAVTIDDVRRKAYGTLEDDIETNLFGSNSILFNDEKEDTEKDLFEDLVDNKDIEIKEEPINIIEEEMDNTNIVEDILDENSSSSSELFDLIDSMYEKGDNK
jgi:hypothetical protein